jgi:hypothetical protein
MDPEEAHRPASSTILRVLAVGILLAACLTALVLQTGEEDLVPCSVFTEFTPCGHRTGYRIPQRIGIVALGILAFVLLFRLARRLDTHAGSIDVRKMGAFRTSPGPRRRP